MLDGIRIVEVEGLGPAPFAGMMLADLGADVIVVHRPGGGGNPAKGAVNLLDRGKRSIALDLKSPDDKALFERLAAKADGLIEGFRPGVMERLGLGPEPLHARNPALVYGRMTGWGQEGPRAKQAGHDLNYIGVSGALWYGSAPGQPPQTPPTLVGDIGGGALYLVAGMLAGLLRAKTTGRGTVVDAAIVDGSAHMMALLMSLQGAGALSETRGQSLLDGPHWSRCYRCACGGTLSVQALEPQFYQTFLDLLGLSDDPAFASQHDPALWPDQTARLEARFATRPLEYWVAVFDGSDACVAPVLSPWQAKDDPHLRSRAVWTEGPGGLQPGAAPRFDGHHPTTPRPPAGRDQHRQDILKELQDDGC